MTNENTKVAPVKVRRLLPSAQIPAYATAGAACFDLHAASGCVVQPGQAQTVRTGLAVELPDGFVMRIYARSGLATQHGLRPANCVGIVDSDYRGEVLVRIHCDGERAIVINAGDRIAQAEVAPVLRASFAEVDALSETERGAGGFGSTGR